MINSGLKHNQQTRSILNQHFFKIFGEIDEVTKTYIESKLEWVELKRNEYLFMQDDIADGLYTVLLGKLEALVETKEEPKLLGYVNPSETVGEMALITGDKRSASIRCYRNATLVKMSNEVFHELCANQPSFAVNISKIIIGRLKSSQNQRKKKEVFSNIAFYRADLNADTSNALSLLSRLFTKDEENYVFNVISLRKRLNLIPDTKIELSHKDDINNWLNELELEYSRIIIDLRGFSNDIRQFLLDYSDICIIFKTFGKDPAPTIQEQNFYSNMENSTQKMRLVLCHPKHSSSPNGTKEWLEKRPVMKHIHIQHGSVKDINRLYRYTTGTSIGLVLGGGGAKAISHLGVLKALKEFNIPIDYICGTSTGAIIAALHALDNYTDQTIENAQNLFSKNPTPNSDLNIIPKQSFYKGKRLDELLDHYFKNVDIEDLWLPFFAVSSNITNPRMCILTSGPIKQTLLASTAVPGLFPPVIIDNEVYVDGGVFSNVPIDVMTQENIGTLIACRVNKEQNIEETDEAKPQGILNTFMKSIMAYSDSHSDQLQGFVDIYFEPDTTEYGLLAWKSADKLIQLGFDHAKKVLNDTDISTLNENA